MCSIRISELIGPASEAGLTLAGAVALDTKGDSLERERSSLQRWQENDYCGEMAFMRRDPGLLSEPRRLLPEARSVLVFGVNYDRGESPISRVGFGRVARYAWGLDYHTVLRARLKKFASVLESRRGVAFRYRVFSDAVPLLERAWAERSGLGFVGKNSMLIRPGDGSFFFIAEVVSDLDLASESVLERRSGECGACTRCRNNCPTDAIVEDRVIDARRCISYLTIEKRGAFSLAERRAIGEWVFGCDICQDVCPFNHGSVKERQAPDLDEFSASQGCGALLDLGAMLSMRTENEFTRVFGASALTRTGRAGLLRNSAVVAANTDCAHLLPVLESALESDPSPLVRQHALWAYMTLATRHGERRERMRQTLGLRLQDGEENVRHEARALLDSANL